MEGPVGGGLPLASTLVRMGPGSRGGLVGMGAVVPRAAASLWGTVLFIMKPHSSMERKSCTTYTGGASRSTSTLSR